MVRTPRPTEAELAILRVLWDKGPSTVRQVNDVLSRSRDTGYTTTLKLMQIMAEKGLVTRDEKDRTHVYAARWSQGQTQHQLVSDLLDAGAKQLHPACREALVDQPAQPGVLRSVHHDHLVGER